MLSCVLSKIRYDFAIPALLLIGISAALPVRATTLGKWLDYDGDGKTDYALWRPSEGIWYIIPSGNPGNPVAQQWGLPGDIPVSGDYDGDGKTDYAVWRPSDGTWYIIPSGNPGNLVTHQLGQPGDIPVPDDFDGDGKTDYAVWRPSDGTWYIVPSGNPGNPIAQQWGNPATFRFQAISTVTERPIMPCGAPPMGLGISSRAAIPAT